MPEDEVSFKYREKEGYKIATTQNMINLNKESSKDGLGEYYEDTVDDFLTNIPTSEWKRRKPTEGFIELAKAYWEAIKAIGLKLENVPKDLSCLDMLIQIQFINPNSEYTAGSPEYKQIMRMKVILKKHLAIDMYDAMGVLRDRARESKTTPDKLVEEFEGWHS